MGIGVQLAVLAAGCILSFAVGFLIQQTRERRKAREAKSRAEDILKDAEKEAESTRKTATLEAREEWCRKKEEFDRETQATRRETQKMERRLSERDREDGCEPVRVGRPSRTRAARSASARDAPWRLHGRDRAARLGRVCALVGRGACGGAGTLGARQTAARGRLGRATGQVRRCRAVAPLATLNHYCAASAPSATGA